jgi:hypothetical protein
MTVKRAIGGLTIRSRMTIYPESGVKIAISDLNRLQSVNLAQDAIGQIL